MGLGATEVVVSPDNDFHRGPVVGIDLALDCVGTPTFHPALKTLRVGGRICVVGNVVPERAQLNLGLLIVMGLRVLGAGGATRADMAALLAAHAEQPFQSAVDQVLPLELPIHTSKPASAMMNARDSSASFMTQHAHESSRPCCKITGGRFPPAAPP